MTDVIVEQLRIACQAPHPRRAEALALRTRLERIARRHLPSTLHDATLGSADAELGAVSVLLDFDPADYDDVTVALLWADRIRRAVVTASARAEVSSVARAAARRSGGGMEARVPPARLDVDHVELVERALAGDEAALERLAVEAASGRGETRAAVARLTPERIRSLAGRLERLARLAGSQGDGRPPAARGTAVDAGEPRSQDAVADRRGDGVRARRLPARATILRRAASELRRTAGEPRPRRTGDLARSAAGELAVHGLLSTEVAGIVLAHPWLGGFIEAAPQLQPEIDPVAARRLALARLVPELPDADADPLVRFLAGDDPATQAPLLAPLDDAVALDAVAEGVLRSFASAIPGFERSTPEFVRRELVVRRGALSVASEPAELLARARPLDVVLSRLPYPIGLVRLPSSPTLSVRIETS